MRRIVGAAEPGTAIVEFIDDLTWPVRDRFSNLIYWFKYRLMPSHQYHLVRTGLPPGYYDEDTRILHACMRALCEHVEIGHDGEEALDKFNAELRDPATHRNDTGEISVAQAERQEEALAIYRWWKHQKPVEERLKDELTTDWHDNRGKPGTDQRWADLAAVEKKIADDEQAMLHRLIDIRPSLWT